MTDRRRVKQLIRIWVAIGAILVVVGYGAFRAQNLAEGPRLEIASPLNGAVLKDAVVAIKGMAKNVSFITLDGNKIFTDEAGLYEEKILLSSGYNIVTVKATDRFGRTTEKRLQLIYE